MHNLRRGFRNLWRSKVRTAIVLLLAGTAFALSITMLAIQSGVDNEMQAILGSVGTRIDIRPAGSWGGFGLGQLLDESLLEGLEEMPHVLSVSKQLTGMPTVNRIMDGSSSSLGSILDRRNRFTVLGTNQLDNFSLFGVNFAVSEGRGFEPSEPANVAIVGASYLESQGLNIGDSVLLEGQYFEIIGYYETTNRLASSAIILPLAQAQDVLGQQGLISEAHVIADDLRNVDAVVALLTETLGEAADVVSQKDLQMQRSEDALEIIAANLSSGLVLTLAAAGIVLFFTMLLIVRERSREIGVLKALGASSFDLLSGFASEAIAFSLIAAIIGGVLFFAAGDQMVTAVMGTTLSQIGGQQTMPTFEGGGGRAGNMFERVGGRLGGDIADRLQGFGGRAQIGGGGVTTILGGMEAQIRLTDLLRILGAGLGLGLLGSLLPALYAIRLKPAEVLRNE